MAEKYKYVIIGGGMTGDAAAKGIREVDAEGSIAMISMEDVAPYARPPLTKGLWKDTAEEKIWKKTPELNVKMYLKTKAKAVDTFGKTVMLDDDIQLGYEKVLIATGGNTIKLPFGGDDIIYYRTYHDYKQLRSIAETKNDFAIIGGGFIGSEIAAALAMNKKNVTMLFPETTIGSRIFPKELAEYITQYFKEKGVNLVTGDSVKALNWNGDKFELITEKGLTVISDCVIGGIGIKPNTELASAAGIKVDNGIITNEYLQTNIPDVYAAGDSANFYNSLLGKRIRVEHEDNANKMGKQAGRNMAGANEPYDYLPLFYSDLFELGYEAIGELDPRLEIIEDWKEKFKEGVIYYLSEGRVKGVLLWNVWGQVGEARKLTGEPGPFNAENLKDRLSVKKDK